MQHHPDITEVDLGRGYVALVDSDISPSILSLRWHARISPRTDKVYAQASLLGSMVTMHRLVIQAKAGEIVDHINGNGIDNRRENLRICSPLGNSQNGRKRKSNTSGFKGVYRAATKGRWKAQIVAVGVQYYIGTYTNTERAAAAYDRAALSLHGEFAALNFPDRKASHQPWSPADKAYDTTKSRKCRMQRIDG